MGNKIETIKRPTEANQHFFCVGFRPVKLNIRYVMYRATDLKRTLRKPQKQSSSGNLLNLDKGLEAPCKKER